jgi:TonB family protein
MARGDRLAGVALALGILGLFSGGGLILGSLVGLVLAGVALAGASRGARDVAWAAVAANVLALATLLPLSVALLAYRAAPFPLFEDDDALPEPAQQLALPEFPSQPVPPPPPPPRPAPSSSPRARPSAAPQPVRVGGSIAEPRKLHHVNPVYPKEAVQARVQGVVVLECTISPAGRVVEVRVLRGPAALTPAAVAAVRQWEYTPTLLNGVAVPVLMTVTVNFKLS